jgi:DNA-binding Xre family transcriptional regulator
MKKKLSDEEWAEINAEWQASGLPRSKWCRLKGISIKTMNNRVGTIKNGSLSTKTENTVWAEIRTAAAKEAELAEKAGIISINFQGLKITADAAYPTATFAALCRELASGC